MSATPAAPAALVAGLGGGRRRASDRSNRMTVGGQFSSQLDELMATIGATGAHYVRCIKPNAASRPAVFDVPYSARQLRCAGVLEAVRISRMAYPNRIPHAAFLTKYRVLAGAEWPGETDETAGADGADRGGMLAGGGSGGPIGTGGSLHDSCDALLKALLGREARVQIGKTKIFFGGRVLEGLDRCSRDASPPEATGFIEARGLTKPHATDAASPRSLLWLPCC